MGCATFPFFGADERITFKHISYETYKTTLEAKLQRKEIQSI